MTTLNKILSAHDGARHATDAGTAMHRRLQATIIDGNTTHGDADLIARIKSTPNLSRFFAPDSKTEVPIAGTINGRFISRRIDRLLINHDARTIDILDYKTDTNRAPFYDKYTTQIAEYATLLRAIYPTYVVCGYILWTHDFLLEKIV